MKNLFLAAILISLTSTFVYADDDKEEKIDFKKFAEMLNSKENTSLAVKTNWQELSQTRVTWKGKVVDVKGGRDDATVYIANSAGLTYRGYNIIMVTYDVATAAKLKPGQEIMFSGIPSRYTDRRILVVTLKEGKFEAEKKDD